VQTSICLAQPGSSPAAGQLHRERFSLRDKTLRFSSA
jgi:hypothetical protein